MTAGSTRALAALGLAVGLLAVPACGDGGGPAAPAAPAATSAPTTGTDAPAGPAAGDAGLARAIRPLPPAPAVPAAPEALPAPSAVTVDALGIRSAPVAPVGVDPAGDMEVPDAREVGWYRFGSRPGDDGSAVLAAHVAYDGVDGVFRNLGDLTAGASVEVAFADGSTRSFTVTEVTRIPKPDLPAETWARDGEPRLALITCGGDFDASAGSYEDNVVAYARPT